MTGFSADWLALREPADTRARDADLTARLARRKPTRFIDIACGTGANLRYLSPRLGGEQDWLLVDNDSTLLARAALLAEEGAPAGCGVRTQYLDLATNLRSLAFTPDVVVTASALLDLVSDRWLTQLVEQCRSSSCAALFVLSYDGRITLTPSEPDDEWVRASVNRHQLSDKGFGPALGPNAARRASELFSAAGYEVLTARSDWNVLPTERDFQRALLEGWASATMELAASEGARCRQWLARRLEHVASGTSRIIVGHEDLLAVPGP